MQLSALFHELPPTFFRPLACKLAPLYWATLETLYTLDFEGEPFEITKDTAVEQIALMLEQNPEFAEMSDEIEKELNSETSNESESPETDPSEAETDTDDDERMARRLARRLLKRIESCGWYDYEYRQTKKGYVLNFRDYSARILHTLTQVAKQEQPVFEGLAHTIKAALSQQELEEKPGVAVYNAMHATKDLVREIKILSRNIHRYADRALKEALTTKALLELQLDIYQKKVVDSNYHRFKTTDNIFRYRSFILKQIEQLEEAPLLQASATQWIARNQGLDYGNANARLDEWMALIRSQMSAIHVLTDDLDRKNARYTAATVQKINYLLNQDHLLEGKLVRLLKEVASLPEPDAWALDAYFPCFRVQTMDYSSLYVPPKIQAKMDVSGLEIPEISEHRKRQLMEKTRHAIESQYSRERVYQLAGRLLKNTGRINITSLPLDDVEDLIRLIFLCYHGRDRRAPFTFNLDPGAKLALIETGDFSFRPGELAWKGKEVLQ
ncbi:MAG: Wadjet anti-phage system protein JetA family protein [Bdellovibrionota bacterium]